MRLSERLQAACELVEVGGAVADIGCDHAFLAIALAESGKASEVWACDKKKGPLGKARENISAAGLSEKVHTVLSDGLCSLDAQVDTIVICGMGGHLIASILEKGFEKAKKAKELILSPQSDAAVVRLWLYGHGFSLVSERALTEAGKYYELIKAAYGGDSKSWELSGYREGSAGFLYSMRYGPYLLSRRDSVLMERLGKRSRQLSGIASGLDPGSERYTEIVSELEWIEEIKEGGNHERFMSDKD